MPKIEKRLVFEMKELAEILVKHTDIHEGHWGLAIEFGLGAANINVGPAEENVLPAAIIPVQKIGIQRFDKPSSITVDAAVVNPAKER